MFILKNIKVMNEEVLEIFSEWLNERFPTDVEHYRLKYLISDVDDLESMSFSDICKKYRNLNSRLTSYCFDMNDPEFTKDYKNIIKWHLEELENEEAKEFDDWY